MGCPPMCVRSPNAVPFKRTRYHGGLLEWDMWARIDRNRLAGLHEYASIGPQIRLSRVALGPPPRHQQTTDHSVQSGGCGFLFDRHGVIAARRGQGHRCGECPFRSPPAAWPERAHGVTRTRRLVYSPGRNAPTLRRSLLLYMMRLPISQTKRLAARRGSRSASEEVLCARE
jgi:hypothetical protein